MQLFMMEPNMLMPCKAIVIFTTQHLIGSLYIANKHPRPLEKVFRGRISPVIFQEESKLDGFSWYKWKACLRLVSGSKSITLSLVICDRVSRSLNSGTNKVGMQHPYNVLNVVRSELDGHSRLQSTIFAIL
jgi:hypothetical protein